MRMPEVSHPSPTTAEAFRRILDERAIQPLFQPLIDLDTRHVLGYEALARGPMGSALESPAALFGAAWRAGRVAELDWACRAAAGGGSPGPAEDFVYGRMATITDPFGAEFSVITRSGAQPA